MSRQKSYWIYFTVAVGAQIIASLLDIDISGLWLAGVLVLLLLYLLSDRRRPRYRLNRFQDELSEKVSGEAVSDEEQKRTVLNLSGKKCFWLMLPLVINCVIVIAVFMMTK